MQDEAGPTCSALYALADGASFCMCARPEGSAFRVAQDRAIVTGDERPGAVPADIVFVIEEKPHPVFSREGNDLVYTAKLPLVDALCGATVRLTSLDGRQLTVWTPCSLC